ncbi:30S ribosomal protein S6 [Candidatus Shikimatogenerans bostrichidophilus]|uniref:30S ribosomal protein S6 n=1 Tax=Candidatus Shikimatogenerans bostrichidophilus TaxID=2943807 RepID=UPI002966D328
MNKHYETIIVFTPDLLEIESCYEEYKNFLIKKNVKIIKEEKFGLKKLAYTIKKKKNGIFYLLEYESETKFIKKINLKMIQDERILRFLTIKMNKYAIEYSQKKNNYKNNNYLLSLE